MGKRKEGTTVAPKKQKVMTKWEDLYTELSPHTAEALRAARVKPEQLATMADGELTAIEGIGDTSLEEIRAKYPVDVSAPQGLSSTGDLAGDQVGTAELGGETLKVTAEPKPKKIMHPFRHGKAIRAAKSKVDRTKTYAIEEAVKLVKATNTTKFDATVTLHLNLNPKEKLTRAEVTFPFMAGAQKRVAIVTDELLKDIEKGKLDFDILLTTPAYMPKLAKYAKVLGPKGLMPNPKSCTVTPNPEAKAKEFAAGKTVVKAEPKFPLMHVTVGKVGQKEAEITANIRALLEAVRRKNVVKAVLAATMSPGVKVQF